MKELEIEQVENGYLIRQRNGSATYNKTLARYVEKTIEDVLKRVEKILKEKEDC